MTPCHFNAKADLSMPRVSEEYIRNKRREIVDAAIKHVDRKTMAHFMDVLLAKRYDDDDYIVLREKDFII